MTGSVLARTMISYHHQNLQALVICRRSHTRNVGVAPNRQFVAFLCCITATPWSDH